MNKLTDEMLEEVDRFASVFNEYSEDIKKEVQYLKTDSHYLRDINVMFEFIGGMREIIKFIDSELKEFAEITLKIERL